MKHTPSIVRPSSAAVRFRTEIDRAVAEGVALDDMELELTPGDAEQMKRDRTVAVSDISFTAGTMRFLGVKVTSLKAVKGEVLTSALRRRVTQEV